jgi:hypothetical protein
MGNGMNKTLGTTQDAAEIIGCTSVRVRQLCQQNRIVGAQRLGGTWVVPLPPEILPPRQAHRQPDGNPPLDEFLLKRQPRARWRWRLPECVTPEPYEHGENKNVQADEGGRLDVGWLEQNPDVWRNDGELLVEEWEKILLNTSEMDNGTLSYDLWKRDVS